MFDKFNREELHKQIVELLKENVENGKITKYISKIISQFDKDFWTDIKSITEKLSIKIENYITENYLKTGAVFTFLLENLDDILKHVQFEKIISSKIANYDSDSFEKMINNLTSSHLSFIEVSGGILGLVAGTALFNLPIFGGILVLSSTINRR